MWDWKIASRKKYFRNGDRAPEQSKLEDEITFLNYMQGKSQEFPTEDTWKYEPVLQQAALKLALSKL